jgi:phage virion morphogenesis protein
VTGARIQIQLDDADVRRQLGALLDAVQNPAPVLREIGQTLVTTSDLAFRGQRDPWGAPWEPLAASTLRQRRRGKRAGSARILRDTGRLATSISYQLGTDGRSVDVGTNVEYAAIHQFGGEIQRAASTRTLYFRQRKDGSVNNRFSRRSRANFAQDAQVGAYSITLPARPYLPLRDGRVALPADTQQDIRDILLRHLRRAGEARA